MCEDREENLMEKQSPDIGRSNFSSLLMNKQEFGHMPVFSKWRTSLLQEEIH